MPAGKPWSATKIVVVLGLVIAAIPTCGVGGTVVFMRWRGHLGMHLGEACGYSGQCASAPCIHDGAGSYCSKLCDSDGDCPAPYVCEPTRSGRRRACMKGGVDDGAGTGTTRRTR